MAAAPGDYNAITLTVAPVDLTTAATTIEGAVTEIVTCLNAIDTTLSGLLLGWAGQTATEARDFYQQWSAAMTQLFGSKGHAADGVLNWVVFALKSSGNNYDAAEDAIVKAFSNLGNHFTPSGGGSDTAPIPAGDTIADGSMSAVGESNWTAAG